MAGGREILRGREGAPGAGEMGWGELGRLGSAQNERRGGILSYPAASTVSMGKKERAAENSASWDVGGLLPPVLGPAEQSHMTTT